MEDRFIVEFIQIGRSIKVTAVDTVTMKEVSIVGAQGASQEELSRLAMQKLHYVLAKKQDK